MRAIAKRLDMARKTVRKILGRHRAPPKAAAEPRGSILDPYETAIRAVLDDTPEMLAPAVLERLRPLGYTGGVTILRDRLRRLRPRGQREAFLTLDFAPGEAMQVDWADFGFALPGVPRRVSAFVAVLCYSRYLYIEFTLSQAMGSFLRCMDRCLHFFGGTTAVDIFDNMKTVVLSHTATATVFNPEVSRVRPRPRRLRRAWPATSERATRRDASSDRSASSADASGPAAASAICSISTRRPPPGATTSPTGACTRTPARCPRSSSITRRTPSAQAAVRHAVQHRRRRGPGRHQDVSRPLRSQQVLGSMEARQPAGDRSRQRRRRSPSSSAPSRSRSIRARGASARTSSTPRTRRRCSSTSLAPPPARCRPRSRHSPRPERTYFKLLAAGSRSIHREIVRLTFLVELFGAAATASAIAEVMQTGHVGAEYVEYVLRHKRGLVPASPSPSSRQRRARRHLAARARPVHLRPTRPRDDDARSGLRHRPTTGEASS